MKHITALILAVSLLVIGAFVVLEGMSASANKDKVCKVFELGDAKVSDIRWHVINNVTGREDGRMELPTQDATYHVEGAFKVSSQDFLPKTGTPGKPEGFVALTDIPSTCWLQDDAFSARLLKRTDLSVEILFHPESGLVLFKLIETSKPEPSHEGR